jgi:hypothetical protein
LPNNWPYKFEDELQTLRHLLARDMTCEESSYDDIRPLVISLEKFLVDEGILDKNQRRSVRLRMLSTIMGEEIESTYDLSPVRCRTIFWFVRDPNTYAFTDRGERFLKDLASFHPDPDRSLPEQLSV